MYCGKLACNCSTLEKRFGRKNSDFSVPEEALHRSVIQAIRPARHALRDAVHG
jgi:hypothetical protein